MKQVNFVQDGNIQMTETDVCSKCDQVKSTEDFCLDRKRGYKQPCKECRNEINREWKKRNRHLQQAYKRKHVDKVRHGGNRDLVMKRQGNACLHCGLTRDQHRIKYGRDFALVHLDGEGRNSKKPNIGKNNLIGLCLDCEGAITKASHLSGTPIKGMV